MSGDWLDAATEAACAMVDLENFTTGAKAEFEAAKKVAEFEAEHEAAKKVAELEAAKKVEAELALEAAKKVAKVEAAKKVEAEHKAAKKVLQIIRIQPRSEGFTDEFNMYADQGEEEYRRMLLEKKGGWWQTGREAKITAARRIKTIYNVCLYARQCNNYVLTVY